MSNLHPRFISTKPILHTVYVARFFLCRRQQYALRRRWLISVSGNLVQTGCPHEVLSASTIKYRYVLSKESRGDQRVASWQLTHVYHINKSVTALKAAKHNWEYQGLTYDTKANQKLANLDSFMADIPNAHVPYSKISLLIEFCSSRLDNVHG